jgi:hypothetical protein
MPLPMANGNVPGGQTINILIGIGNHLEMYVYKRE